MSVIETLFDARFPEPVEPGALALRGAKSLAALLTAGHYDGARLLRAARREDSAEMLLVEAIVPLGQRKPVNDVREVEQFAIAFFSDDKLARVYPLRDGFPDVPHLNLAPEGEPRSLCLFEMPEDEALRVATPFVLIERVRHWLRETAHGRLHAIDQPLDPLFAGSHAKVVLPPGGVASDAVYLGFKRSDSPDFPILLTEAGGPVARRAADLPAFACLSLVTPPVPHGRLRELPATMWKLIEAYDGLAIPLLDQLRDAVARWARDASLQRLLDHQCLLLVSTPVERTPGTVDGVAAKGFFLDAKGGELGEAIGAMTRTPDGKVGFMLGAPALNRGALETMSIAAVDLHRGFDRLLAQAASGYRAERDAGRIALVGAGALGSQVAIDAARGGLGRWAVIDPDHLMPHNLARHALTVVDVGVPKADAVAGEIAGLLGSDAAEAIVADVRSLGPNAPQLLAADMVIDASASVPVSRWLACESRHAAPTTSVFLNPSGDDLVILREGEGRTPRLDHLEMTYYALLAVDPFLAGHLRGSGSILPSGGCRNPSVQLPQTRVAASAALAVDELFDPTAAKEGGIAIWHRTPAGVVRLYAPGRRFAEVDLADWRVAVDISIVEQIAEARAVAGELETGGILVGGWDRQLRKAWVVAHLDPPPDSEHSRTGFVRGSVGVHQTLDHIEASTAVNLTYVGEWHTHPPGHRSAPSDDDRLLMEWIGDVVAFSDVPPLMLIAGEDGVRLMLGSVGCAAMLPIPDAAASDADTAAVAPTADCDIRSADRGN